MKYNQLSKVDDYDARAKSPDPLQSLVASEASASASPIPSATVSHSKVRAARPKEYWDVFVNYPMFRYYFLSSLCFHIGIWLVRIASLLVVAQFSEKRTGSSVGNFIISTMIPKAVFAQFGGIMADCFDRRKLMISLDVLLGFIILGNIFAVQRQSLNLLFVFSAVRSSVESMYYPAMTGMVPLLFSDPRDLQLAVTIDSWSWCVMAIAGGGVAGIASAVVGYQACFIADSASHFLSALLVLYGISGNFNVREEHEEQRRGIAIERKMCSPLILTMASFKELAEYLSQCGFGMLVFMKATAALSFAPESLVSVAFTTVTDDKGKSSLFLGATYTMVGVGSLVGPLVLNLVSDATIPSTLQRACLIGLVFMMFGWLSLSFSNSFGWLFLVATFVRNFGSRSVWIISTLTLQTLTEKKILGRVLAMDYSLYSLVEVFCAVKYGHLYDQGMSKQGVSRVAAWGCALLVTMWGSYHALGLGAAGPEFNSKHSMADSDTEESEMEKAPDEQELESRNLD